MDNGKAKLIDAHACFICDGPHFARECPKREKLNDILFGDIN